MQRNCVNSTDEAGKWLDKRVQDFIPAGCMHRQFIYISGSKAE